jgi:glycosyltransferase involved in cell wall biosynthesis
VEPKNPEQVAAAIIELIKNPELYKRFSEAGIKTAKNFTWQAAGLQLEKIFEKALAASKNG